MARLVISIDFLPVGACVFRAPHGPRVLGVREDDIGSFEVEDIIKGGIELGFGDGRVVFLCSGEPWVDG